MNPKVMQNLIMQTEELLINIKLDVLSVDRRYVDRRYVDRRYGSRLNFNTIFTIAIKINI